MSEYKYLAHHGIKGMEWGKRRWQDYAGKLTAAGRERYGVGLERAKKIARFGAALGKAKGNSYRHAANRFGRIIGSKSNEYQARLGDASRGIQNRLRRKIQGKSIQIESLRRQRDYYERKSRGRQFIKSLAEKKEAALTRAYRTSDDRFRARMNAGRNYIYNMSQWEDMMAHPRGRDKSWMQALPTRVQAAKHFASKSWRY